MMHFFYIVTARVQVGGSLDDFLAAISAAFGHGRREACWLGADLGEGWFSVQFRVAYSSKSAHAARLASISAARPELAFEHVAFHAMASDIAGTSGVPRDEDLSSMPMTALAIVDAFLRCDAEYQDFGLDSVRHAISLVASTRIDVDPDSIPFSLRGRLTDSLDQVASGVLGAHALAVRVAAALADFPDAAAAVLSSLDQRTVQEQVSAWQAVHAREAMRGGWFLAYDDSLDEAYVDQVPDALVAALSAEGIQVQRIDGGVQAHVNTLRTPAAIAALAILSAQH